MSHQSQSSSVCLFLKKIYFKNTKEENKDKYKSLEPVILWLIDAQKCQLIPNSFLPCVSLALSSHRLPAAPEQQMKTWFCPSAPCPSEQQQLSVPHGAAEALDKLHAALSLQVLPDMLRYVPVNLQGLEVVKVWAAQLPQAPGGWAVALPGLGLQQEVLADGGQVREQLQQAGVSVVQMDPHGDSQAQTQVEEGAAVSTEVALQRLRVCGDVKRDEGDVAGQRVGVLRSLNQSLVQVEPQEMNFSPLRLVSTEGRLHHMVIEGYAQVLSFTQGHSGQLLVII